MIPELLFISGGIHTSTTISQLEKAADPSNADFTDLFLASIDIDVHIVNALRSLLDARLFQGIHIGRCTGLIHHVLGVACSRGVSKVSLLCDFPPQMELACCQALGRCLRFGQIRKLVLQAHLSTEIGKALYEGLANSSNTTLEELTIPLSNATWPSIRLLSETLPRCRALRKLSLSRHNLLQTLDEGHLSTIIKSIGNHPSLQELCIQGSACPPGGISAISEHLLVAPQSHLLKLDLSNHRFGMDVLEGLSFLLSALQINTTLKFLSLSGHRLSRDDMNGLSTALTDQHSGVEKLCLADCQISNDGIAVFAERIVDMPILKTLWLQNNPFDASSASKLLDGMRKNTQIECLTLPHGRGEEMDDIQREIDFWLLLNQTGRRLLSSNRVPPYLWAMLLERAAIPRKGCTLPFPSHGDDLVRNGSNIMQATSVFYLLRHGPTLFER